MSGRLVAVQARLRRLRVDRLEEPEPEARLGRYALWAGIAGLFVLLGAADLDLGPIEARQGLAAGVDRFGPLGQVVGGWDPSLWPARVVPSQLWARASGATTGDVVRWPDAAAALAIGFLLSRRLASVLGIRAGILAGLCLFGSVGLMDRSAEAGLDLIAGLAIVGALDRILSRGSDLVAGLWAASAVLAGGWPPLAMIVLPIVVLGRPGKTLSAGLLAPPILTFVGWSAWALNVAPARAWAAALTLPMTQGSAWELIPWVVVLGLPWAPFAALSASRAIREGWGPEGRALVLGWLQVAGVAGLSGTLIPGLAPSARIAAMAGLALAAGAVLDRAWQSRLPIGARRAYSGIVLGSALAWALIAVPAGVYLAAAVPYYRTVMIVLVVAAAIALVAAGLAARNGHRRRALGAVVAVAVGLKLAHGAYFVPEWNYRMGQGPWGRAIAQWMVPSATLHTLHGWPPDLLFATGHSVRQLDLGELRFLQAVPPKQPMYFLLQPEEFAFWGDHLRLVKLRELLDEEGKPRVVARTPGPLATLRRADLD